MKFSHKPLAACAVAVFAVLSASAASIVTVDNNGHGNIDGTPLSFSLVPDPGPSSTPTLPKLTYALPFTGVGGDVELLFNSIPIDVLRFNANGTIVFYGGENNGSLADTPAPPFPVANTVQIPLVGSPGNGSAVYAPTSGQPGFDASGVSYDFISDAPSSTTPEPASLALLIFGGACIGLGQLRRKRA